jgi:multidrug resistance efflux pump
MTNHFLVWRRIARNWPFLLWLAVLVFIMAFYSRNQQFGQMAGTVEAIGEDVVPQETARLVSLNVVVGQSVAKGDVLAQMDTSLIDAEVAIADATFRDARETFTRDQRAMVAAAQQSEAAAKTAESALKTEQMRQKSDAAQIVELRRELKRREDLLSKRLIDEMSVNELRPVIAALDQALTSYPKLIEIYQQAWESAVKHGDAMKAFLRMDQSDTLMAAISNKTTSSLSVIEATREMAIRRKSNCALRANRDGVVARIFIWPGNVVAAGIPIMNVVDARPSTVVGFLPEVRPLTLKVGQEVRVWRQTENILGAPRLIVQAIVDSVAPAVEALPVRINPMQVQIQGGQPLRGRRLIFRLQGEHDFSPGETVEIREVHEGWLGMLDRWEMRLNGHTVSTSAKPKSTGVIR